MDYVIKPYTRVLIYAAQILLDDPPQHVRYLRTFLSGCPSLIILLLPLPFLARATSLICAGSWRKVERVKSIDSKCLFEEHGFKALCKSDAYAPFPTATAAFLHSLADDGCPSVCTSSGECVSSAFKKKDAKKQCCDVGAGHDTLECKGSHWRC
jgi:hypothetical protein